MATEVEVQTAEVGRTLVAGRLHLTPLADSSNSLIQPHLIGPEPNKPLPCPKPRLTPKPFALDRNLTVRPIVAPKPLQRPRSESSPFPGHRPHTPSAPKPPEPAVKAVPADPGRPASTSFKCLNRTHSGQTTKPVVQPFKPAPPLASGDLNEPIEKLKASSLAHSHSLKKPPAVEWSASKTGTPEKERSITRAKSMGFLSEVGKEEEDRAEAALALRAQPRSSRPRPVSELFLHSPTKASAPAPGFTRTGRRPLSTDLTARFQSIGLSLHRKVPRMKENTPGEQGPPQEGGAESACPEGGAASTLPEPGARGAASEERRADSVGQPGPEAEPAVGVKQLIRQLTEDTPPTQSPAPRPATKPRPLPLARTKRFSSERSPNLAARTAECHDLSGTDAQRGAGDAGAAPSEPDASADREETPERKASGREPPLGSDVQRVRLFENVVEKRSVLLVEDGPSAAAPKAAPGHPSAKRGKSEAEGTLVTATYADAASPSSPLRAAHAFDRVRMEESRAVSEKVPAAQREDKAMTLRSRRTEAKSPEQPRYLRVGALQRWTVGGFQEEAEPVEVTPKQPKRLQSEEHPKAKATYFALTGKNKEVASSPAEEADFWAATAPEKMPQVGRNLPGELLGRPSEPQVELQKNKAKMRELEREKQRQLQLEKDALVEFELQRRKMLAKQELEEKQRVLRRQRQLEVERQQAEKEEQRQREEERQREEMETERMKEIERQREMKENEMERQRQEMGRQREIERQKEMERQRERERQKELDKERMLLEMQREKQMLDDLERQRERQRQLELEKKRKAQEEADRLKQMAIEQEMLRMKEIGKEKERQRELERQRQLDMERQEMEKQRLRQEKEKKRLEEMERVKGMERRLLLDLGKQQQAEQERQRLREEAQRVRQRQQELEDRQQLRASALRPRVVDLDSVVRKEHLHKAATRWREPSGYKPAILDVDAFGARFPHSKHSAPAFDCSFGAKAQSSPERDISWKVPSQTVVAWTLSPQDPWELQPVEMSVDQPAPPVAKQGSGARPEDRLQVPPRNRPTLLGEHLLLSPSCGTEGRSPAPQGGVPPAGTAAELDWLPRELQPPQAQAPAQLHRRSHGSQELNRWRSRSTSRRSTPPGGAAEPGLSRIRSRSAHREHQRHSSVQQKPSQSDDAGETLGHDTDSQYGTWETGLRTDDSLTPSSDSHQSPSPRKATPPPTPGDSARRLENDVADAALSSVSPDVQRPVFPDAPPTLLDTSALRSRAQLVKKRAPRTRPSRAARTSTVQVVEDAAEDWLFRDSTETKVSQGDSDSDSEELARGPDGGPASSSQPPRVALFPGVDASALKAQLKKRADFDNHNEGPAGLQSQPSRSPKSPFLSRAARVLPPAGGKENGEEDSPQWLKELKSKKRLSQYDGES